MAVPFLDLTRQDALIGDEVRRRVEEVASSQQFILGEPVERFERSLAEHEGVEHAVGVASGSDALLLALRALGVGEGDEVVTVPFTFVATAEAVRRAGARPVFVDVDPDTLLMDPERLEQAAGRATAAVLPVHLYGQMADMEAIREVADRYDAVVLEDAAQAVGARLESGDRATGPGRMGDAAALSFFPAKNLGAWGDGGAVLTDDAELADRVRRLRVHGSSGGYRHEEIGTNSRLDALQAAVLKAKLPHLRDWNRARREHARWYDRRFAGLEDAGRLRRPAVRDGARHVYHQYTLRAEDRDGLRDHLSKRGIGTGVYYRLPLHLQPCFRDLGYREGDFPESERAAREVISLPVFPELTEAERREVADAVEGFHR